MGCRGAVQFAVQEFDCSFLPHPNVARRAEIRADRACLGCSRLAAPEIVEAR